MLSLVLSLLVASPPQVQGALDKTIIARVVRRRLAAVKMCMEKAKSTTVPAVEFRIRPDGSVVADLKGGDPKLAACLKRVLEQMRFPAAKGGGEVHVRYPLNFSMADGTSTFGADVDTGSYGLVRKLLSEGVMPDRAQVRVEELVNHFHYDYDPPVADPFSIQLDGMRSPVDPHVHLLRVGLQARIVTDEERLPANLVFLVDTSCSMSGEDRIELAKQSIRIALKRLDARDTVAITTYAGRVSTPLPATPAARKKQIRQAIDRLTAAGSTAMGAGLETAYAQAARMHRPGAVTRVIVLSDGDANLGPTTHEAMLARIEGYVREGVRLSTVGFGTGNYRDDTMEQLADRGNGNYFYVGEAKDAERIFGRDLISLLQDVAQDVKLQVTFDPKAVKKHRLIGYENRALANEDFEKDVDAGEVGAGHQMTAVYELELAGDPGPTLGRIAVRAKPVVGNVPQPSTALVERTIETRRVTRRFDRAPVDARWAVLAAAAAELLRGTPGPWTYARVRALLEDLGPKDPDRRELIRTLSQAELHPAG